jgi:hypothetical protein
MPCSHMTIFGKHEAATPLRYLSGMDCSGVKAIDKTSWGSHLLITQMSLET